MYSILLSHNTFRSAGCRISNNINNTILIIAPNNFSSYYIFSIIMLVRYFPHNKKSLHALYKEWSIYTFIERYIPLIYYAL